LIALRELAANFSFSALEENLVVLSVSFKCSIFTRELGKARIGDILETETRNLG
jgi:hypothetical protein